MPYRYLSELMAPSVRAAQEHYGSRDGMERLIAGYEAPSTLGPQEIEFIRARDGFYLGTVGESGWPYVQHRGGPPGFLHVLDDQGPGSVLGWADFRGNRQYVSVGHLGASPRVSLFLMDYATRRRMKVLGTARVLDARAGREGAQLAERLAPRGYDARTERVVLVEMHSYDWNCPQHITPRWSRAELEPALAPLRAEIHRLREENAALRGTTTGGQPAAGARPEGRRGR
ncbi:pyridoxamine 5'-phosphate oxidase [Streptomyces sulfonofaciens]|uniref:Pyridoxamine 5'-phosphate oxidase n=1 Tax=Streptomyces sulfonofaciens TaxID=68272 RepID=A0A919GFG0_9ACTN|nr:pyridoxamine 5'-phosphate oxidase family protein [Streptomyces sulfonofaciens]GHH83678.1 pyridoxamine 5'-phosphate oxidase [Streptomyces sulfonofaciens]